MTSAVLSTTDLFIPAPSGVGPNGDVPTNAPNGSWLSVELLIARTVKLPTTSWQSGAPERTILAINAVCLSQDDAIISGMAQGGFLGPAASGTVTYVALNGQTITVPVTPDPSIPSQNPTGAPGWLDLLCENVYDTTRLKATYATGPLAVVNTTPSIVGPFTAGTYHVANASTGQTYSNPSSVSIPSSIIAGTGGVVAGVTVGLTSSIIQTQTAHGLSVGDVAYVNIQVTSGVSGLAGVFGTVTATSSMTFAIAVGSSGAWTSGGTVYKCTQLTMVADALGIQSNAGPGTVTSTVTSSPGVSCTNLVAWSAANWESNAAYAARSQLGLASDSPDGPKQIYVYIALKAQEILASETPSYAFTNGPIIAANEFLNPQTGVVITVVASATPASTTLGAAVTPGCAQLAIVGATNTNPIQIQTASPHNLLSGYIASIDGVLGNTNSNGTNPVVVIDPSTFSIPVAGNGAYTGGGTVEGGDLGAVDALLQESAVPDNTTAITQSALALPTSVVATVVVPQAQVAAYRLAAPIALQTFLSTLPIGGFPGFGVIPYDGIVGALEEAGVVVLGQASYVRAIQGLTVNGGTIDVPYPTNQYQALLATPILNVVGV